MSPFQVAVTKDYVTCSLYIDFVNIRNFLFGDISHDVKFKSSQEKCRFSYLYMISNIC